MPKISIDEASAKQLRDFAIKTLNLEINPSENSNSIRAKILATMPNATEIDVADAPASNERKAPAAPAPAAATASAAPAGRAGLHFKYDPKVKLRVMTTTDPTRPKEVQLAVGGDVIILKRGHDVEIPYRFYLALNDAIETVARDTDEINPTTFMPMKEWVQQHSYPFQILAMPSDAEIDAWQKRTAAIEMA